MTFIEREVVVGGGRADDGWWYYIADLGLSARGFPTAEDAEAAALQRLVTLTRDQHSECRPEDVRA